jgi:hypothetical protein
LFLCFPAAKGNLVEFLAFSASKMSPMTLLSVALLALLKARSSFLSMVVFVTLQAAATEAQENNDEF